MVTERATRPADDTSTRPETPGRWRFVGLAYALWVLILGTNLPTPLYSVYRDEYHFNPLILTLIFAVYAAALIPALLVCGPLSDTIGHRRLLLTALVAAGAGAAVFALASGPGWLFAARAIQGLAVGAASGALTVALIAAAPQGETRKASLMASVMTVGGGGAGPVLAGVLAQYAPASQTLVYLVEIALLIPALGVILALPKTHRATSTGRRRRPRPRLPHVPTEIRRGFTRAAAATFLAWAVAALFLALVPSYAIEMLHTTNLAVTGAAAGLILLTAAAAQAICTHWSVLGARSTGLVLLAIGLAGLVLAGALASIGLLIAAAVVAGAGQGLTFMAAVREVNDISPATQRGEVLSAFYVATYSGVGIPVIGTGLLAAITGLPTAVAIFAAVIGPCCLILLTLTRTQALRDRHA